MVLDALSAHCGEAELKSESPLKECFHDSVEETCFYTQVEIEFGLDEITADVRDGFITVGDLVKFIAEYLDE